MKTRFFLTLCLLFSLLFVNSCNKGSGITPTVSTYTLTLPDGISYPVESGGYSISPDHELSAIIFCNMEQAGVLVTRIHLSEQDLKAGKELSPQAIRFEIPTSSHSRNYADSYSGHVYLDSVMESTLVFRFDNVRFTLARGSFMANGLLICYRVREVG